MDDQREVWTERAADWRHHAEADDADPFNAHVNRPAFLQLVPPPGRLTVELGAGNGGFTAELAASGHRVVATDIARDSLDAARHAVHGLSTTVADAARMPLHGGVADLVVAFMSLQDLDDLRAAIAEAARLLVPGGVFCFSIVHPIRSAGTFTSRDPDARFSIDESYFEERRWDWLTTGRDGSEINLPSMHRPVSAYLEAAGRRRPGRRALRGAGALEGGGRRTPMAGALATAALLPPRPRQETGGDRLTGTAHLQSRADRSLESRPGAPVRPRPGALRRLPHMAIPRGSPPGDLFGCLTAAAT